MNFGSMWAYELAYVRVGHGALRQTLCNPHDTAEAFYLTYSCTLFMNQRSHAKVSDGLELGRMTAMLYRTIPPNSHTHCYGGALPMMRRCTRRGGPSS